jgi:syntaxin-binding protein 5
MFLKHDDTEYADFSSGVRDSIDWKIGTLREFEFPLDTTSAAFDPVLGLLAIGGPHLESSFSTHI